MEAPSGADQCTESTAHTLHVDSIRSWERVESLVANKIPETSALDYKEKLTLGTRSERVEMLKDLSGMGNGGGGTVVFGIEEREDGIAAAIRPLTDRATVGRLEDVVRDAVRPPLLVDLRVLEGSGGFVLVAEILRSPLGPYMVEAYDQRRYFVRIGRSTAPMTEQQVRDAYLLAARAREGRPETWEKHHLPMRGETADPWLVTSALPEEPLIDLFDPAKLHPDELKPPAELEMHAQLAKLDSPLARPRIWAEGVYGEDGYEPTRAVVRLHRDGGAGLGVALRSPLPLTGILRALHGQLLYLAWFWRKVGLRMPAELDVRVRNLEGATIQVGDFSEERTVSLPPGLPAADVALVREVLLAQLVRASSRHGLVGEFADRLHQAFGLERAEIGITTGWLYGREGRPLEVSYHGRCLWDREGRVVGYVYENGLVESARDNRVLVGFLRDGALLDPDGRTMAVLEFATGHGVPDEFVHREMYPDPRARVRGDSGQPNPTNRPDPVPDPLGEWSDVDLWARLRAEAAT